MAFLAVNNFFWCIFKNTEQNNNCVFIVFKAESEPKHEEKICFWLFFFKNQKRAFAFFVVNNFFLCVFKNTEQNNNCVFTVFKAESEPKHKEKI